MSADISAENLGVCFAIDRQRRPVTPAMRRLRRGCTTFWALRGASFHLRSGMAVAVVGPNGAGKTTLLRAIAGVLAADEGRISVRGRVGALLSVDAGLSPALTGRENCQLVGVLAGMARADAQRAVEPIRRRSELGVAFERPISTYSQGMRARLGLSIIEQTDPQVLVLDEVHEAIDERFRVGLERLAVDIRRRGGIVVAAGHDHAQLMRLCDRVITIESSGLHAVREWHAQSSTPETLAR